MKKVTVNPKDEAGAVKPALNALPAAGRIHGALAAMDGNAKYGFYNYRESKIFSYMMYLEAIERHLVAVVDGEDLDPDSKYGAHHLGAIIASAAIILDGVEQGNILDDRPPKGTAAAVIRRISKRMKENAENDKKP